MKKIYLALVISLLLTLSAFPQAVNTLAGGSGGTVVYQSAASVTAFLANGTAGQVLTSNGTTLAPSWTTISGGITNSAGNNVITKSNGTNVVASTLTDDGSTIVIGSGLTTGTLTTTGVQTWNFQRTRTAPGTTGAQTINKPTGSVNFAAGASSLVVTNSIVATTSFVLATAETNDATCFVSSVVPAAGSFTIRTTSNCTAETLVAFWVLN